MLKEKRIEWKKTAKGWKPYQKFYLEGRLKQPSNLWQGIEGNKKASLTIKDLFDGKVFDTPKPVGLIARCLQIATTEESVVLDFFAGSATTAHAVIQVNAQDAGKRKFIMVQLPEACDEKSEAFKSDYKTIAEISKERIRRAGTKIKAQNADKESIENLDIGFRVLKIDTSNMAEVYYNPAALKQEDLLTQVDNVKPDRTDDDLLFQVMLDWGVDLTLPIHRETIQGKTVFFVDQKTMPLKSMSSRCLGCCRLLPS